MEDERKSRDQLLKEIVTLRAQLAALQAGQDQRETCQAIQQTEAARANEQTQAAIQCDGRRQEAPQGHRLTDECYLLEMADHIQEVFWVFSWPLRKVVYVSPAFESIWKRPAQQLYEDSERWYETLHPDDREATKAAFAAMLNSEGQQQWEYRIVRPDGSIRWVSDRAYAVRDEDGTVSRVVGVSTDITEYKRSEEAVRASEARLSAAIESLPFDFFMLSPEGRYVMQNSVSRRHWGDMIGKSPKDVATDDVTSALWQDNNRRALAGAVVEGEVVLSPNGRQGYYHNIITPIRVGDEIQGILGINIDLTDRREAEQALQRINNELEERVLKRTAELEAEIERRRYMETELRDSEEKYRTLVESAGETIAVIDAQGIFQFMNKTAATRLRGKPEDFTGKSMWDLFPKEVADRQVESVRKTVETGQGANSIVLVDLPGEQRWYNTTIEPIRDADGKPRAALVIARDIHDLRQAHQQLDQYQQHMRQAERLASVGTLSATVAHELTQPLTVIRLSIQFAMAQLKKTGCPPAALEALNDSLDGVADVASRVERFRNYARQSSKANPTHVRLGDIVARTFGLLEDKARSRRVALMTEGLDTLPTIHADLKDLEQMCFALTENAIQAADGETDRRLTVRGELGDSKIILAFEDTCGGIPDEDLGKIFEPFFTTKPLGEGTGLGLCIVETTVSRLGGKITVETFPSLGSTFRVTLPLK